MSGFILLSLRVLSAVALYAFLGWALLLLWRLLRQDAQALASRKLTPLALSINTPDQPERIFQASQGDISIGRDPDCECVVPHVTVSARHARLAFHHNQWWVDDLQSTNGTTLNDEALQMPTVVVNGDTIKCGQVKLTIILNPEEQSGSGEQA